MRFQRRNFVKGGLAASAFGLFNPYFLKRQLVAQEAAGTSGKKLIFIFQRGGNDGINTVIPRGDADYNEETRPTIFIPEEDALDLGNNYAQLHPMMAGMMELYNKQSINGTDGPGNLAMIHRVGYANQSRSHFDSQEFWEHGVPGNSELQEGVFYRQLANSTDLTSKENAFVAASISGSSLLALRGSNPLPNFTETGDFTFRGSDDFARKFLGQPPTTEGTGDGRGVLGLYGEAPARPNSPYADLVHGTGKSLGESLKIVQSAINQGAYAPENGAVYPDGSFGDKLQEAAMLFKRTPARVLGINIGGWDTHADQGAIYGSQGNRLQQVAGGFQALYRDLKDQWDDVLVVTMTEFGRTSKENGGGGTDHAEASAMFVAGGAVKGGTFNCDADTWKTGDMFSKRDRYLARNTDFRSVLGEIFMKHFGDDRALLDTIIPGYTEAEEDAPDEFKQLGFL